MMPGMTSILAQLSVRRGPEALEFYKAAFGAAVDYQVGDDSIVAQLSVGEARFWVSDEAPEFGNVSPETLGGASARLLLLVDDPDAYFDRAIAAGATEVFPVQEEYGWRLGRVADPFGHHWEIGKPLGEWPPTTV
jgi:PhnB protein